MVVARVLVGAAGVALVLWTLGSAIAAVVLPRAASTLLTRSVFGGLREVFGLVATPRRRFETRDRVLALYAPLGLLLLPVAWASLVIAGFTMIFWASGVSPWSEAFAISGSSLLTLGFDRPEGTGRVALAFVEALIGLGLVTLLISYLPTIYQSFSRREALVGKLGVRGGLPPSPSELLTRYTRIGFLTRLEDELFADWEQWFVELEESHTTHPALVYFRSPQPGRSWITAAGCVLDTAALSLSTITRPHDARVDLMLRTGFLALRRIADYFGIPYDPDPAPDGPISVTRREFDLVCVELTAAGIPLTEDRDQAWRDFAGWRVNYDEVLVALCALVDAPPAQWSTDRVDRPRPRPRITRRGSSSRSR